MKIIPGILGESLRETGGYLEDPIMELKEPLVIGERWIRYLHGMANIEERDKKCEAMHVLRMECL